MTHTTQHNSFRLNSTAVPPPTPTHTSTVLASAVARIPCCMWRCTPRPFDPTRMHVHSTPTHTRAHRGAILGNSHSIRTACTGNSHRRVRADRPPKAQACAHVPRQKPTRVPHAHLHPHAYAPTVIPVPYTRAHPPTRTRVQNKASTNSPASTLASPPQEIHPSIRLPARPAPNLRAIHLSAYSPSQPELRTLPIRCWSSFTQTTPSSETTLTCSTTWGPRRSRRSRPCTVGASTRSRQTCSRCVRWRQLHAVCVVRPTHPLPPRRATQ